MLEPIEEKDLDLQHKFKEKKEASPAAGKSSHEIAPTPEIKAERKEGVVEKDEAYSKILSKVKKTQPTDDQNVPVDAKSLSLEQEAENKVEKLIQLAMQKGVVHAVKVARHLQDNYALDELHDRLLAEELHNALVKKGLIEEI